MTWPVLLGHDGNDDEPYPRVPFYHNPLQRCAVGAGTVPVLEMQLIAGQVMNSELGPRIKLLSLAAAKRRCGWLGCPI